MKILQYVERLLRGISFVHGVAVATLLIALSPNPAHLLNRPMLAPSHTAARDGMPRAQEGVLLLAPTESMEFAT